MAKTSTLHVRMDPQLKVKTEKILKKLGISSSEAITLFYAQISMKGAIPFQIDNNSNSENGEEKKNRKSLAGYLSKYANSDLIEKESGVWESEASE